MTNPVHPDPDALPTLVSGTDELPTIATRAPPSSSAMGLPGQAAPDVPDFDAPTVAAVIDDPRLATFFNPAAAAPEPAPPTIAPALAPRPPLPPPVAVAPPSPPPPPPVAVAPPAPPPPPAPVSGPLPASSFRPATSSGMPAVRPGSGLLDPALPAPSNRPATSSGLPALKPGSGLLDPAVPPPRPVTSSMPSLRPGSAGLDPAVPPPNRPATSSGMPALRSGDVPAPVRPKTSSGMPSLRTGEVSGGVPVAQRTGEVGTGEVSMVRPRQEAASPLPLPKIMAGGVVVVLLLALIGLRRSPPPPPPPPPPPMAAPVATARPAHFAELAKLSAAISANADTPAGRDALWARARLYAEHKDYPKASEDLRRLLRRKDVESIKAEATALMKQVETERLRRRH